MRSGGYNGFVRAMVQYEGVDDCSLIINPTLMDRCYDFWSYWIALRTGVMDIEGYPVSVDASVTLNAEMDRVECWLMEHVLYWASWAKKYLGAAKLPNIPGKVDFAQWPYRSNLVVKCGCDDCQHPKQRDVAVRFHLAERRPNQTVLRGHACVSLADCFSFVMSCACEDYPEAREQLDSLGFVREGWIVAYKPEVAQRFRGLPPSASATTPPAPPAPEKASEDATPRTTKRVLEKVRRRREELAKLVPTGMTIERMAERLGWGVATISDDLREMGIHLREKIEKT